MFESQRKLLFEIPSSLVYPRKLDTALRGSTLSAFRDRIQETVIPSDDLLITSHYHVCDILKMKSGESRYAILINKIFSDSKLLKKRYTQTETS